MASHQVSCDVLVHSRLILQEVRVHSEGPLDRAVFVDLRHDLLLVPRDAVGAASEVLVFFVGRGVARLADLAALGGVPSPVHGGREPFTWCSQGGME